MKPVKLLAVGLMLAALSAFAGCYGNGWGSCGNCGGPGWLQTPNSPPPVIQQNVTPPIQTVPVQPPPNQSSVTPYAAPMWQPAPGSASR